jgi:peptidoglycan/xylan/chitin deacetylase (PgdA/CDA1 family)
MSCKSPRSRSVDAVVKRRTINLTFHGVGEPPRALAPGEADVWVSGETCTAVLDSIAGRDDVRITFDDGNISDYVHGLPALMERGLNATFFVVGGRIGAPGFLHAEVVRALLDAGMQIGSHGMEHRRWRGLSERELRSELEHSKAALEVIVERPVTDVACPFGAYDRRVLRMLRSLGYRRVYTSDRGWARPDDFLQPRTSVTPTDGEDLVARIECLDKAPHKALSRRAKLAVKRWR